MSEYSTLALLSGILPPAMLRLEEHVERGTVLKIFKQELLNENREQEQAEPFYYIRSGMLKVFARRSNGSELNLVFYGTGTLLELPMVRSTLEICDTLELIACENTVLVTFSKEALFEIFRQDPMVFADYQQMHIAIFRMLTQRMRMTACMDAQQRIWRWLFYLAQDGEALKNGHCRIDCPLTQQEIADYLFVHITTFHRIFTNLKQQKILTKTKSGFEILNLEAFETLCREALSR